eukprot:1145233-Pleurochrysis_carterae.AAC.1
MSYVENETSFSMNSGSEFVDLKTVRVRSGAQMSFRRRPRGTISAKVPSRHSQVCACDASLARTR